MAAAFCGVLAMAACEPRPVIETWPELPDTGWREVRDPPLSPRQAALGLWTGREVLLVGGSDASPCPPSASCVADPTPLRDGAALDPAAHRWRRIADSPVPLADPQGVVVGSSAYILGDRRELLVYRVDRDRWQRIAVPFDPAAGYGLVAAGDRVVAFLGSDEGRPGRDYAFDPATAAWTALPADPLGAGFDRAMAWTGRELVLFDHELVPDPGARKPAITRAAVLDPTTRSWRRLPDSAILSTSPWIMAGDRLVNPTVGGADGGAVGNWGRTFPDGGSVAPATGIWSALPKAPAGDLASIGARTGTAAIYYGVAGLLLDTTTNSWLTVRAMPGPAVSGCTIVAAGVNLLVSGGARWTDPQGPGTLVDDVWLWVPPAPK
jgi:hypothetical protein